MGAPRGDLSESKFSLKVSPKTAESRKIGGAALLHCFQYRGNHLVQLVSRRTWADPGFARNLLCDIRVFHPASMLTIQAPKTDLGIPSQVNFSCYLKKLPIFQDIVTGWPAAAFSIIPPKRRVSRMIENRNSIVQGLRNVKP